MSMNSNKVTNVTGGTAAQDATVLGQFITTASATSFTIILPSTTSPILFQGTLAIGTPGTILTGTSVLETITWPSPFASTATYVPWAGGNVNDSAVVSFDGAKTTTTAVYRIYNPQAGSITRAQQFWCLAVGRP